MANTSHGATHTWCAASTSRRRPQAQERAARSLPERPSGALSSTTASRRTIAIMPPSWPLCWQPYVKLQPPYAPSAAIGAKACEHTRRGRCQLQPRSRGGLGIKGRAAWHVPGGSPSSGPCAAFEIIMLTGCRCRRAHISVRRFTQVPATASSLLRFACRLDGHMATTHDHVPIISARSCGHGAGRGMYLRKTVPSASRRCENTSYRAPLGKV